ncbi:hypothetical protein HV782_013945 [Pseudomonas monsensis]|uniref:hypothetical protein n=1 Tax=Pseudomonas monsensis TaxID=2745509 RepID=UPI0016473586|nr:hypothetical protein [Pseudomonas monsensis]QXI03024.1 hypothetical protein HV782_013945 [Pseudomonas monsensis]
MNPFEEPLQPNALDAKQANDFFMKLQSYIALAESDQDVQNRFHLARSYLVGWIHGGGDLNLARTFEGMIDGTQRLRRTELLIG